MSDVDRPTVFALSSGRPPAAIAVIRISGPRTREVLEKMIGRVPQPRVGTFARVRDPQSGEIIDEALALWFPGPHSETGEDSAELQIHGGQAVITATIQVLARMDGVRLAEGGEFTRRAFENGKLDLTAIEGLADLIAAETEAQRRQAFRQMKGLLANKAEDWRLRLIEALAHVEARIDFSDEGDVPDDLGAPALAIVHELIAELDAVLADARRGERLRDGLVVAVAGPPNAGKSTLLNRIAQRDVAIVSPHAGTTRDVIEVHLDLGGYAVTLLDTAGIRESHDPVEQEGVRRARERVAAADLVLWVVDATESDPLLASMAQNPPFSGTHPVWTVQNKIDLLGARERQSIPTQHSSERGLSIERTSERRFMLNEELFAVSASDGQGVHGLVGAVERFATANIGDQPALVARERHREVLKATRGALARSLDADGEDIVAEELRLAGQALGRLTGRVDVEDILDVIFRDFCIGK